MRADKRLPARFACHLFADFFEPITALDGARLLLTVLLNELASAIRANSHLISPSGGEPLV